MNTGFESCSNADLKTHALNIKQGLDNIAALSPEVRKRSKGTKGEMSPALSGYMKIMVLASVEAEMWRRGIDPRSPEFGFDWIGLHDEMMV